MKPIVLGMRQLSDITSVLDKLAKLANDLTMRCAVGQLSNNESSNPVNLQSLPYRCMNVSVTSYNRKYNKTQKEHSIIYKRCHLLAFSYDRNILSTRSQIFY